MRCDNAPQLLRQAQRWFKRHGGSKSYDPWNLDSDNDGKVCETYNY